MLTLNAVREAGCKIRNLVVLKLALPIALDESISIHERKNASAEENWHSDEAGWRIDHELERSRSLLENINKILPV